MKSDFNKFLVSFLAKNFISEKDFICQFHWNTLESRTEAASAPNTEVCSPAFNKVMGNPTESQEGGRWTFMVHETDDK